MVPGTLSSSSEVPGVVMLADLLCDYSPAVVPARSLQQRKAARLARLCRQALVAEAELTPKPGLVDRRGSGSHKDLSLSVMRRSAIAIEPYFYAMALISSGEYACQDLRERLAVIGRAAESAMYKATGGSNAHKGAIWILGLLVSGAAITNAGATAGNIAHIASKIAAFEDRAAPGTITHGHVVTATYGVRGARGEALEGFPHIVEIGLPTIRDKRSQGLSEAVARRDTLLSIMSRLDDTCILYRGKAAALRVVKAGATKIMAAGGCGTRVGALAFMDFDRQLVDTRISPGGSADLLAATLFIDAMERGQNEVQQDQSWTEE